MTDLSYKGKDHEPSNQIKTGVESNYSSATSCFEERQTYKLPLGS